MKPALVIVCAIFLVGCATLSKQSTSELKLRHAQLEQYLASEKKGFEFKFGPPLAMAIMGDERQDRIEEKESIERELLRRWKHGDKDAHLPIFDNSN